MLEPYEVKVSRAVLRQERGGNTPDLLETPEGSLLDMKNHGGAGELGR